MTEDLPDIDLGIDIAEAAPLDADELGSVLEALLLVVDTPITDEALAAANDTEFGLAAYMYTRDLARSWRVSEAIEYGIVGLNTGIISTEVAPFGGVKESGTGREGSKYGILDYTEIKYVCVGGVS